MPVEFDPWNPVYIRFSRRSDKKVWHNIFAVLLEEADVEEVYLDSTVVRAHQHAAGSVKKGEQRLGRSRGGLTTKIYVCVEGLGQAFRFILIRGQCHDVTQAGALIRDIYPEAVLADEAYVAEGLIFRIVEKNAKVVTPPKSNRIA